MESVMKAPVAACLLLAACGRTSIGGAADGGDGGAQDLGISADATLCGNGRLDEGEACDVAISGGPGACPSSCPPDGLPCTVERLEGEACQATCARIGDRRPDDGCCPLGTAEALRDPDCLGPPVPLPGVNTAGDDCSATVSADGLTIIFASAPDAPVDFDYDLMQAVRIDAASDFGGVVRLPVSTVGAVDFAPTLTGDGLRLYFQDGAGDLRVSARADVGRPFATSSPVAELDTADFEGEPSVSADGLALAFSTNRPGGEGSLDVWLASRTTSEEPWGAPVPQSNVDTDLGEFSPGLSADGLELFFASNAGGVQDIYYAWRRARGDPFSAALPVAALNLPAATDRSAVPFPDGSRVVFCRIEGDFDLWISVRSSPCVLSAGSCRFYVAAPATREEARLECEALGGGLAEIGDAAEDDALRRLAWPTEAWIGLSDVDVEGTFVWDSGEAAGFTRWMAGAPHAGGPDCVVLGASHDTPATWDDVDCGLLLPSLCEVPSP
jgi:lectin-like protein/WD40 repeat protein